MRRPAAVALVALAAAGAAGALAARRDDDPLRVYAAASLTEVLRRIDEAPAYSFAGSNTLAFQLEQGAPADVFASASPGFTRRLFRAGIVERPVAFATNALVLAVPRANPGGVRSVLDLRRDDVRLVVGTERVPVGAYGRRALRRLGLGGAVARAVSHEPDVKGIVGKLALGGADAGLVYATDVRAAAGRLRAIALPARAQPEVRYEIAVVAAGGRRADARAWIRRLTGARGRRLLAEAGFGLP